jgi:hypothetical protein
LVFVLALSAPALFAQENPAAEDSLQTAAGQDSSHILDDVVIQEKFEGIIKEEKIPIDVELDFTEVIKFQQSLRWDSIDSLFDDSNRQAINTEMFLSSPALTAIRPAPVKIFQAKFKSLDRWKLEITANDGSIFRTMTGKGTPASTIGWDGHSDDGQTLIAGQNYAYTFVAVDKAGNQKVFPGQTFTVPACFIKNSDGLLIGLDSALLFAADGLHLKPGARRYADEAASLIRYYSTGNNLNFSSTHPHALTFIKTLTDVLCIAKEQFTFVRPKTGQGKSLVISAR